MIEKIICAAIFYDDGIEREHLPRNKTTGMCVAGWRHANCVTQLKVMFYDNYKTDPFHDDTRILVNRESVQGFLTSNGNFVDREEGAKIAYESNQIGKKVNQLYSEDIY